MNPFEQAPAVRLKIADLIVSPTEQVRVKGEGEKKVAQYCEQTRRGSEPPPILVARCPRTKTLAVVDGFHRLAAIRRLREGKRKRPRTYVWAHVADLNITEGRWYGSEFNAAHGVPLTKRDHRRRFRYFMDAGRWKAEDGERKTLRTIQVEFGGIVSHHTIHRWMHEDYPHIARRYDTPGRQKHREAERPFPTDEDDAMGTNLEAIKNFYKIAITFSTEDRQRMADAMAEFAAKLRTTPQAPLRKNKRRTKAAT
jgi:hypothetical protein